MKKVGFVISFFLCFLTSHSQTVLTDPIGHNQTFNKYLVKINPSISYNTQNINSYLKKICAAASINFNSGSGYFEVLTKKQLERNIIEGKLQKNTTPMVDFIFLGEIKTVMTATANTAGSQ